MATKVYVGNLSWSTNDDTLRETFAPYALNGQIVDSIVMRDRETGRSRGFGFVTFATEGEAQQAINNLNEVELDGRRIKVNLANARPQGGGGGGGGYSGGGGGGGYNSGGGYGGGYPSSGGGGFGGYSQGGGGGGYGGGGYNQGGFSSYNSKGSGGGYNQGGYPNQGYSNSGGYGGGSGY